MAETILHRGKAVYALLENERFIQQWNELAALTQGFTRLQESELVIAWYRHYEVDFEPILIVAKGKNGYLDGIICLALNRKSLVLIHAGNAEYHGWLAGKEKERYFLETAFGLIKKELSIKKWNWRFLPPGLLIPAIVKTTKGGIYSIIEKQESPVWDLTDIERLQKLQRNKSFKSKLNRLRRRGKVQLELITSPKRLKEVLQTAKLQYDFRQEAVYNNSPFADDPHKIDFCAELMEHQGVLHSSALWLDQKLLACHMGVAGKDTVCLGMICHNPTENKNSPGTLLIVLLAKALQEQGYKTFDLTPGTHSYKDRFATSYQILYKPTIYFSKQAYLQASIKEHSLNLLKKTLKQIGISPPIWRKFKISISIRFETLKSIIKNSFRDTLPMLFFDKAVIYHYGINLAGNSKVHSKVPELRFQAFEDLLYYNDHQPFRNRRGQLLDALSRFKKGDQLVSVRVKNSLEWYVWVKKGKQLSSINLPILGIENQEDMILIHDFYLPSQGKGDLVSFYKNLDALLACMSNDKIKRIALLIPEKWAPDVEWLESWDIIEYQKLSFFKLISLIKFKRFKRISLIKPDQNVQVIYNKN